MYLYVYLSTVSGLTVYRIWGHT